MEELLLPGLLTTVPYNEVSVVARALLTRGYYDNMGAC